MKGEKKLAKQFVTLNAHDKRYRNKKKRTGDNSIFMSENANRPDNPILQVADAVFLKKERVPFTNLESEPLPADIPNNELPINVFTFK